MSLLPLNPAIPLSVQNIAPPSFIDEICSPLFEFIIVNSKPGTSSEQLKSSCKHYLEQFFKMFSNKNYQEQIDGFRTCWKTIFLPKLESYSQINKFIILTITFYCMAGCDAARIALYQAVQQELPRLINAPGNIYFILLDYFWKEDWQALGNHIDASEASLKSSVTISQIRSIAALESLQQKGVSLQLIMGYLDKLAAWNRLQLLDHEKKIIYSILLNKFQFTTGTQTLSQKCPHLTSFLLFKKGHHKTFTHSPWLWKLFVECVQQRPSPRSSTPLQAPQASASQLTPSLAESFEPFVTLFKDSRVIPNTTEFSQIMAKIETALETQRGAYFTNQQKDNYDIFLAFWYQVLKHSQTENPIRDHQKFFSKCSLVIRPFLPKARTYIAIAFLAALLRLDPNPIHLFLEQTYTKEAYLTFWKSEPSADNKLSEKIQAITHTLRHEHKNFNFEPLFFCVYLRYFCDFVRKSNWSHIHKNLLEKLLRVAPLGRPLDASETGYILSKTVYIEDQTHLFTDTGPTPLQNLFTAIKALGEDWKIKNSDQQKAFIQSHPFKLSETDVEKLFDFFVIPEHLGCFSSQAHLIELKQVFPQFFDYCQKLQPENLFIQSL